MQNGQWGTQDEIKFLQKLGTWKFSTIKTPRHVLLKNYINEMEKRVRFDLDSFGKKRINRDTVLEYANKELRRC